MKKFDIKWLLILVLVVILAFGLVACGNKGGGSDTPAEEDPDTPVVDPTKSTPSEFFGALWDASKSLGTTEVDPTKDKIHIGMAMDISLTSDQVKELDVGVELGLVADLASMNKSANADMGDSALMLKAFDKATNKNWITLWYFLKDEKNLYFQVQDQSFKVAFDAYWNDQFSTLLQGVLKLPVLQGEDILSLINGIARTGGEDWSLDTLILGKGEFKGILAAFGLDIGGILENDMVKKILPKGVDSSSLGSILQGLGGVVIDSTSCKKYSQADGSTQYVAGNLSKTVTNTLLNSFTDGLFDAINALSLSFNVTKDGDIDGLTIAISGKRALINTEIKINITDLTIETVPTTTSATNVLGTADKTFQPYVNISWEGCMDASAWGVVLDPDLNPDTPNIKIGKVLVKLDATIDLVGDYASNKTAAQLTITNDITPTNDNDAETVLIAVYKNHTLTLETDLTSANNKAIAVEALSPLTKLIKDAAVAGDDVTVPYAIFGAMADEIRTKMFSGKEKPAVSDVKENFTSIVITGVDIATLAKGAFYAILSDFATGAGDEKPGKLADLEAYAGPTYFIGTKEYEKGQYAWSLNIKDTVATVLKAINYAGTKDQKDKDYSIDISSIYATLKGVFKDAEVETADGKTKTPVAKPANINEMMALFMCTNDGILLDLTKHGLLPLVDNNGHIVNNYITNVYTPAMAAQAGYSSISGKMITKANALAIWSFLTSTAATPELELDGITVGTYFNPDTTNEAEKNTIAGYVQNSAIAWFLKFINGTTLVNGSTAASVVGDLTGENSGLSITLNRKTGAMSCDVKLKGLSTVGYINYTISGVNAADAYDPDAELKPTTTNTSDYVKVDLQSGNFYTLFEAAFGMGPTTSIEIGHGLNTDMYIEVTAVPTYDDDRLTSVAYAKKAIILGEGDDGGFYAYEVSATGVDHLGYGVVEGNTLKIVDESNSENILATYTIYGNAYKLIKKN